VFDRAPELLGAGGDFTPVSHHTVAVAAVDAVELFDSVEVSEHVAVNHDVFAAFNEGDAVNPEADLLIDGHS